MDGIQKCNKSSYFHLDLYVYLRSKIIFEDYLLSFLKSSNFLHLLR